MAPQLHFSKLKRGQTSVKLVQYLKECLSTWLDRWEDWYQSHVCVVNITAASQCSLGEGMENGDTARQARSVGKKILANSEEEEKNNVKWLYRYLQTDFVTFTLYFFWLAYAKLLAPDVYLPDRQESGIDVLILLSSVKLIFPKLSNSSFNYLCLTWCLPAEIKIVETWELEEFSANILWSPPLSCLNNPASLIITHCD